MATAVARHAGARFIVVSEPNAYRRELATRMGATLASTRARALKDVQRELGMVEGFDVVFEMSGNARRPARRARRMAHGGGMAILGIPTEEISLDVNAIVFKMLTPPGHLRPGDVRDLVQDDGHAQVGARHHAGHHPPLRVPRARGGLRRRTVRRLRQSHHGLDRMSDDRPIDPPDDEHAPPPDPLAFLDDEVAALANATCIGRCGS